MMADDLQGPYQAAPLTCSGEDIITWLVVGAILGVVFSMLVLILRWMIEARFAPRPTAVPRTLARSDLRPDPTDCEDPSS